MDNSIYEVERDDYVGFIGQLNKTMMEVEEQYLDDCTFMKIKSKSTGKLLCTRIIPENGDEHYFIFEMPEENERIKPTPVMKVNLETREQVQEFFNALNKLQLEANKHD